jgi:hypothetical protein
MIRSIVFGNVINRLLDKFKYSKQGNSTKLSGMYFI